MAIPAGIWLSFINQVPGSFPNDGILILNDADPMTHDFDGDHFRPLTTRVNGQFTPGTSGTLDHINFEETDPANNCVYTYDADLIQFTPNHFVTLNGKRHRQCPPGSPGGPPDEGDDEWVGTHTT